MSKIDIYKKITNKIIIELEKGTKPWVKDWNNGPESFVMPRRSTGEYYKGINILLLWISATEKGLFSEHWFTYKQAALIGGNVKKGSKATKICFYGTFVPKEDGSQDEENTQVSKFIKTYNVFNADQIENLPEEFYKKPLLVKNDKIERDKTLDMFFRYTGAKIKEEGNSAHYNRTSDTVVMPPFESFNSTNGYYSTLAHECAHWTGSKERLDRTFGKKFGDKKYAFEELVAELSAIFTMSSLGYSPDLDNSVSYISNWIKALKNDPKFIFTASSQASKATDYLYELYPLKEDLALLKEVA